MQHFKTSKDQSKLFCNLYQMNRKTALRAEFEYSGQHLIIAFLNWTP